MTDSTEHPEATSDVAHLDDVRQGRRRHRSGTASTGCGESLALGAGRWRRVRAHARSRRHRESARGRTEPTASEDRPTPTPGSARSRTAERRRDECAASRPPGRAGRRTRFSPPSPPNTLEPSHPRSRRLRRGSAQLLPLTSGRTGRSGADRHPSHEAGASENRCRGTQPWELRRSQDPGTPANAGARTAEMAAISRGTRRAHRRADVDSGCSRRTSPRTASTIPKDRRPRSPQRPTARRRAPA